MPTEPRRNAVITALGIPRFSPGAPPTISRLFLPSQSHPQPNGLFLGWWRSLDRSSCCRPGFTVSWPQDSAIRRTRRPILKLRSIGPWTRWNRSCSKPRHLSDGLDRGWTWYELGLYDAAFATLGEIYRDKARSPITMLTLFGGFSSTICWPLSGLLVESFGWRLHVSFLLVCSLF